MRTVRYKVGRLRLDMANRGWMATDLARAAGVSEVTVSRFLNEQTNTAKTAAKLAAALGYSVRRYVGGLA
jgi:plasmid maintenance system antidote protein VapI